MAISRCRISFVEQLRHANPTNPIGSIDVSSAIIYDITSRTQLSVTFEENELDKNHTIYVGSGNYSAFSYDGYGRNAKILEYSGGSLSSTKQFVSSGDDRCEARDGSGNLLNQYFLYGQTISGNNYYYAKSHWMSVREMTDSSGVVQAEYAYDAYGRAIKLRGSLSSDFEYSGYYTHAPSQLCLTLERAYDAMLGRWINRDPIRENGGINLYAYVSNEPIDHIDPSGTSCDRRKPKKCPFTDPCSCRCWEFFDARVLNRSQYAQCLDQCDAPHPDPECPFFPSECLCICYWLWGTKGWITHEQYQGCLARCKADPWPNPVPGGG